MIMHAGTMAEALARAAATAGYAPSVHNTQPWRWTVLPDRMELTAVTDRQLSTVDPDRRLMVLSCGAALHHASTALSAAGWDCAVTRLPDERRPNLLAVVAPTAHHAPDPSALRLIQAMERRHTDRRPLSGEVLPDDSLAAIAEAVRGAGAYLHVLTGEQVFDLAAAADRADAVERSDPATQQELAYWIGRGDGLGIPEHTLPAEQPATTVPERDFGRPGSLPAAPGHDHAARYGVLYGDGDEPLWWLRAGEALSAAWLTATGLGASVLPLSAVVEVTSTRAALRRLIAGLGWPYLVLRLGIADPEHLGPAPAPRLATAQFIDLSAVRRVLEKD